MLFFLKKLPLSILSLITLSLLALSAQAQQPAEPTSVIPYQGTLFSQGKPVSQTDPVKMAFAIYSDDTGLNAGQSARAPALNRKWTSWASTEGVDDTVDEDKTIDIQVRNGRFLAHLGEEERNQQPLRDSTFTPDPPVEDFYVVTWVVKDSGGVFRLPPQKLGKVPHAVTAERAHDFEVMGELTVKDRVTISEGGLDLFGSSSRHRGIYFGDVDGSYISSLRSYDSYIAMLFGDAYRLRVFNDNRGVWVEDYLRVNGTLKVYGDIEIDGSVKVPMIYSGLLSLGNNTASNQDVSCTFDSTSKYHSCTCLNERKIFTAGVHAYTNNTVSTSRPSGVNSWLVRCYNPHNGNHVACSTFTAVCARL